ncbi:MAG TPA: cytidine deaminase [bacterium]
MTDLDLVNAAWKAREFARAAYSGYRVGAALLSESGQVYTGANVESSTYGLSLCAERVALVKALSEGDKGRFITCAVVAEGPLTPVPCGACRQLLADYAPFVSFLLAHKRGEYEVVSLFELFPRPFSSDFLK